jgi:hypothetical protein
MVYPTEPQNKKRILICVCVSFVVAMLVFVVSGCAGNYISYLNTKNATQDKFMADRYSCLQETQQPVSGAYANQYGAISRSSVTPSCSAFTACLAARGYVDADTTNQSNAFGPGHIWPPTGAWISCVNANGEPDFE